MDAIERIYGALQRACADETVEGVALSGGIDSTIVAHMIPSRPLYGITVISTDYAGEDIKYCHDAAAATDVKLHIATPDAADLLQCASETVRILGCFSDVIIRNAMVMHVTISEARRLGISSLAVGDGADELFAGYGFLARMEPALLRAQLDRIWGLKRFAAHTIGESLGVRITSPFLHQDVVEAAASLSPDQLIGEYGGTKMGKMALRNAFVHKLPSAIVWRPKSPMQDGAGTVGMKSLLDSLITDQLFANKAKAIQEQDTVRIRTKESLYYYQQYVRHFGPLRRPDIRQGDRMCPDCLCPVSLGLRSCRMCGAFPV